MQWVSNMKQKFFAVKNNDDDIRKISSSGGIFLAFADFFIKKGGIVYGAIYNQNFEVIHSRADNIDDAKKMTGSKYSRSELNEIFKLVKNDLKNNKLVLFSGTPCQIFSLKRFLKNDYENLFTIDIICHGTPEKKYLKDYINYLEKKYKSKLIKLNMRYKDEKKYNGNLKKKYKAMSKVSSHTMMAEFENGKKYISKSDYDVFYQLFDYFICKGCFKCIFSNLERLSDITIGDFHEFSSSLGDFNDGNGVSLMIVNSDKGLKLLKKNIYLFELVEKKKTECLQPALIHSLQEPSNIKNFYNDYSMYGFEYISKKYCKKGLKFEIWKCLDKLNLLEKLLIIRGKKSE